MKGVIPMAKYVDGFVLVIPKNKTEEYKKMAIGGRDSWMKHGALGYYECRGDSMAPHEMGSDKTRSFTDMAGASSEEDVWFSFIIFKSKEHRDAVNALVMEEMSKQAKDQKEIDMPFDMKRMSYGGFQAEVEG